MSRKKYELKDIVPPLELCKLIPAGEFEDSVLVWVFDHQKARKYFPETQEDNQFFYVENREFVEDTIMSFAKCGVGNWINRPPMISAPTLAEIFRVLPETIDTPEDEFCVLSLMPSRDDDEEDMFWIGYNNTNGKDANPATAALRLWLKVKGNGDVR